MISVWRSSPDGWPPESADLRSLGRRRGSANGHRIGCPLHRRPPRVRRGERADRCKRYAQLRDRDRSAMFDPARSIEVQRIPAVRSPASQHTDPSLHCAGSGRHGSFSSGGKSEIRTIVSGVRWIPCLPASRSWSSTWLGGPRPLPCREPSSPPAYPPAPATMRSSTLWRVTRAITGARSSPATSPVAYDFGTAGVARDVHAAGGRLAAVVGGRVAFGVNPVLGPIQRDSGGAVHVVDLAAGIDRPLDGTGLLFRRPALSPDAPIWWPRGIR